MVTVLDEMRERYFSFRARAIRRGSPNGQKREGWDHDWYNQHMYDCWTITTMPRRNYVGVI
jgi:hypothetical protein